MKISDDIKNFAGLTESFNPSLVEFEGFVAYMIENLKNSSILEPGNACKIKYSDLYDFFSSILKVKKMDRFPILSLCDVGENTRKEFLANILKSTEDPFELCGLSFSDFDDMFRKISPLQLKKSASFETCCNLNDVFQKDILSKIFNIKPFEIDKIKEFCKPDGKSTENVLQTFYNLIGSDFLEKKRLCSTDQSIANQTWKELQKNFELSEPDRNELITICKYEENFMKLVMNSSYPKRFNRNSELKELCFLGIDLRNELIEKEILEIRNKHGQAEKFETSKFSDICKLNLNESKKLEKSLQFKNITDLVSLEVCSISLRLGAYGLNKLYGIKKVGWESISRSLQK
jgi:hypothetical protein